MASHNPMSLEAATAADLAEEFQSGLRMLRQQPTLRRVWGGVPPGLKKLLAFLAMISRARYTFSEKEGGVE